MMSKWMMNWTEDEYSDFLREHGKTPLNAPKKRAKYGNRKVWVDGFPFDSQLEANRYTDLKLLHRAGEIKGYCVKPKFILTEGTGPDERCTIYEADFGIWYPDGHFEIEDTKGYRTEIFDLKMKMMREKYPDIEVNII